MATIFYLPRWAKNYGDLLDLSPLVSGFVKWSQADRIKQRDEYRRCYPRKVTCQETYRQTVCTLPGKQLHHIRPVWACALQWILDNPPRSLREYVEYNRVVLPGVLRLPYSYLGGNENLIPLCARHHPRADARAN
jgi:hypothetical protein